MFSSGLKHGANSNRYDEHILIFMFRQINRAYPIMDQFPEAKLEQSE